MVDGVSSKRSTRQSSYLEDYWHFADGRLVIHGNGTQFRDLTNSGLIPMARNGIDGRRDVADSGKRRGVLEPGSDSAWMCRINGLARKGAAKPVSQGQIFRR